ncbi:hypothetical protein AB7Y09_23355, partial [Escherichia coli]
SDGNGSHASTSKTPSYTKSVSWQHHLTGVTITVDNRIDKNERKIEYPPFLTFQSCNKNR